MLEESFEAVWMQAKGYALSVIKAVAVAGLAYLVLKGFGLDPEGLRMGVVMALVFWGAVMRFFGPHWTHKGFWTGIRGTRAWVGTATPVSVWRFGAWVCWAVALVCLVVLD